MLKEIAPNLTRAALLANPKTAAFDYFLRSAKTLAPSLAIEVVPLPIENANDIERSIEGFAREGNGGLAAGSGDSWPVRKRLEPTRHSALRRSAGQFRRPWRGAFD